MKNFFTYPVFVVLFLSFIGVILYGSVLRHHHIGGDRFQSLQNTAVIISEIPMHIRNMIKNKTLNLNKVEILTKHKDKKRFEQFKENKRNALLVIPRYEHSLNRSVVDIIDLNNFEVIHTYKHDVEEMNDKVKNFKEFPDLKIDFSQVRFSYFHPLLFEDGSFISKDAYLFKVDFCSNTLWINDEEGFHHSVMLDHEGNIWVGGFMNPKSKYVEKFGIKNFEDDSIVKINTEGQILFNKSVIEILIENDIVPTNFAFNWVRNSADIDPIHLNDIEPALSDTKYWQQGDVFMSIRDQSAIIHYRPNINKVINFITGPFAQQHDVDIISDKEISIFNNNNFYINNKHSEVLVYNFETKAFKKIFNDQLQKENFKTPFQGLSHTLNDGSLMVEESEHGRIILFNNKGEKEWEFVNKDKNGDIGFVSWSRIIEDETFIKNFKSLVKNKKCSN